MPNKEQLKKIAIYCDSYEPKKEFSLESSSHVDDKKYKSCENCIHFTEDSKCELDLIDKVLSNLAMELDLKS